MRHQVDGRKFGRNTSHRIAMYRNMANAVLLQERIITTVEKAKEIRRVVDRLITLSKPKTLHSRRLAYDRTRDRKVVEKLTKLADRYQSRPGGYTRVLKLSDLRRGDAAQMAVLELVDAEIVRKKKVKKTEEGDTKKETQEGSEKDTQTPKDTFGRFRKLFNKKGGDQKGLGGSRRGGAQKSGASHRTMAGTGGGKQGGSSS